MLYVMMIISHHETLIRITENKQKSSNINNDKIKPISNGIKFITNTIKETSFNINENN